MFTAVEIRYVRVCLMLIGGCCVCSLVLTVRGRKVRMIEGYRG